MDAEKDIETVLFTEEILREKVRELGAKITEDYKDKPSPVLLGILKGSYVFLSDLARQIKLDHTIEVFLPIFSF